MFNRLEVIVLTDIRTNKRTNRCRWKHPPHFAMLHRWVKIPTPQRRHTTT